MAVAGGILFTLIILAAVIGPWLVLQYNGSAYDTLDLEHRLADSSVGHPLGTDTLGRDLLARVLYGSRISLVVGIVGTPHLTHHWCLLWSSGRLLWRTGWTRS